MTRKRSRKMIKFAEPGPDDDEDTEDMMDYDLLKTVGRQAEAKNARVATPVRVQTDAVKLVGPFEVRLNDVYDSEGRSVARCGYIHNTRTSGPPMAEVVCAALNRGYRKV